jgi:hydrogenase maturation protease
MNPNMDPKPEGIMPAGKNKILILGIGNDILTDDGIGPRLCDFLRERFSDTVADFEKLNVGGLEVLEFIDGYETVVIIDAIKTVLGRIGDIYLFTPDHFKETLHISNLHDTSFITALKLGRSLEFNIPGRILIIAVEIKEDMVFSESFTSELAERYVEVQENVMQHLEYLVPELSRPPERSPLQVN